MSLPFAPTWLAGEQNARSLLPAAALDRPSRAQQVLKTAQRKADPAVLQAIADLSAQLPPRPARDANLAALQAGSAVAVVTGQQLGLFHGPLFTLHKAATAVAAARQLQAETGVTAVPIFWLQGEDHDAAEIDHAWVPRPPGPPVKLHAPLAGPPRASVGALQVSAEMPQILDQLAELLRGLPHAPAVIELLQRCWAPGQSLALAVARQMDELLGDHGLLVLDPRHPAIRRAAIPLHRQAFIRVAELDQALAERGQTLQDAGFAPQVQLRPGSPLSFVAPGGDGQPRFRLVPRGHDTWGLSGGDSHWQGTTQELLDTLENFPERWSSSALLRPLLQDLLLPTAFYIGGPAEIGYLAQIQPLYGLLGIEPSAAVLRAGFTWMEPWLLELLGQRHLSIADLRDSDQAWRRLVGEQGEAEALEAAEQLRAQLWPVSPQDWQRLTAPLTALDPSLERSAQRAQLQIAEILDKLTAKYSRATAARHLGDQAKLQRAQVLCWPAGQPQERFYSWPWFAARFGVERLSAAALAQPDAFSGAHHVEAL
jgi:bacillithiol biosynthesis cysteine-adding enzyme BshC